jgi:hypothetical protein
MFLLCFIFSYDVFFFLGTQEDEAPIVEDVKDDDKDDADEDEDEDDDEDDDDKEDGVLGH